MMKFMVMIKMSILIEHCRYKRMLKRRVELIKKKLAEIDEIKLTYGTLPTMGEADLISKIVSKFQDRLED